MSRDELHLGDAVGDLERPVEPDIGGDVDEQVVEAGEPEGREHLVDVVVGVWREPHGRTVYGRAFATSLGRPPYPDASSSPYFVTSER